MRNLIVIIALVTLAQAVAWVQLQGQFFSGWMKSNPWTLALLGFPVSLLLIEYTKRSANHFGGEVWPGRLIGFAIGILVFALMSYFFLGETLKAKTIICLFLSALIVLIQIIF